MSRSARYASESVKPRGDAVQAPSSFASEALRGLLKLRLENAAPWMLLLILAWSPFPLGSNRPWSWSLLVMMVAAAWLLWLASMWRHTDAIAKQARPLAIPLVLAAVALAWGVVQVLPFVPGNLVHPAWSVASAALKQPIAGTISLDPWRTEGELMKLGAYAMTAWLAYSLSRDTARARLLFLAIMAIGIFYVFYAWTFALMDWHQFKLFYSAPDIGNNLAAPFINRNTLATYAGIVSLCCGVKLFELGSRALVLRKSVRRLVLSAIQFSFGSGTAILVATVVSVSLVVATGSLGGTLATITAIVVMLVVSTAGRLRGRMDGWTALTSAALALSLVGLVTLNSGELAGRLGGMATAGLAEDLRLSLWSATERMIADAPFLGLGLGTFEPAYPLYAQSFFPLGMDKAHNDFLELAAGWGIPAALAWWAALAWLASMCLKGVFVRQRDRIYALVGVGATVLGGVHSMFDFSLQIPAVSILYAALLGLGVAQSLPSRARGEVSSAVRTRSRAER